MSQPKFQLETFKSWAGIDSDISYYLNSHHIDVSVLPSSSTQFPACSHLLLCWNPLMW